MSRHPELYPWQAELAKRFPTLAPPYGALLALWSLGMILVRSAGLVAVTRQLMPVLGQGFHTVRQRLREFYQEAAAKAGAKRGLKRRDFQVTDCFAPLLAWILSFWTQRRLALALDVTNLGDRLHVLCVSVLFGGIGIPVAWWAVLVGALVLGQPLPLARLSELTWPEPEQAPPTLTEEAFVLGQTYS